MSMLETLADAGYSIFYNILLSIVSGLLAPVNLFLELFADAGALQDLTTQAWATNLIAGVQGIACALLAVRVAWEALQMATVRAEGAPTDPGGLLKRTFMAGASIFAGPWLARQMIYMGNLLAQAVGSIGLGVGLDELDLVSLLGMTQGTPLFSLILTVPAVVLLIIIFFQGLIRTIEITLAAIISPFAALGFISGGGMADVWWREVMVISTSQAVQMLLVYLAAALLVAPTTFFSAQDILGPFLFIAALWVAFRTPVILRNYAYSTGVSGAAGGVAHTAGYAAAHRLLAKLPV